MRIARLLVVATVGMGASLLTAGTAHADTLDACGDFFFDPVGDVECELAFSGGCEIACEPLALSVECAAELQLGCSGGCDIDIEAGCDIECQGGCELECEGGEFDCRAYCEGGCSADCNSYCEGDGDETHCRASCEANCSFECGASCDIEFPSCEAGCEASCEGGCYASANAECQIDCQADGYIDCEAELSGGCTAACESPEGALICNGQWVNTDDLESCADAIIAYFDIEVDGYFEAECEGDTCTVEAGCSLECATGNTQQADFSLGLLAIGFAGAGVAGARRIRRKK